MTTPANTALGASSKEHSLIQEGSEMQSSVGGDGISDAGVENTMVSRETVCGMSATYSPEDNKLRLYSVSRLSSELYERVKAVGFKWAPKQELFVAPMWTPGRADLLVELCGEIGDEDTRLVDRAEQRAERFDGYRDRRTADAHAAQKAVAGIADNIPLGQPILVGHHSERHARRDAERIENGMRKAVQMWDTAQYWKSRAAGALAHAEYKERPEVRARRIKTIEADRRKHLRAIEQCEAFTKLWQKLEGDTSEGIAADADVVMKRALLISDRDHISRCFSLAEFPRVPPATQYEGTMSLWSALDGGVITPQQARDIAIPSHARVIVRCKRWTDHYDNRLAYERAMLEGQGASDLLKPKQKPKQLPLCNYRAPEGITYDSKYRNGESMTLPQQEMTQVEYARISKDYKGTRIVENSHRIRVAMRAHSLFCVFLSDAKVHVKPEAKPAPQRAARATPAVRASCEQPPSSEFDHLRQQLKHGVKVAVAPQLFPTPYELVQRMVELAEIKAGDLVLEPSAGTGRIVEAIIAAGGIATAVEINQDLVKDLRRRCWDVRQGDFMACHLNEFDVAVMNPPFANAQDIEHIMHAFSMLKPGGRLVAICANGPRQNDRLRRFVEERGGMWEVLPADTFKESGTSVSTVLLQMTRAI